MGLLELWRAYLSDSYQDGLTTVLSCRSGSPMSVQKNKSVLGFRTRV